MPPSRTTQADEPDDDGKPNVARAYDCLLGGQQNAKIDQETAKEVLAIAPSAAAIARSNRAFLTRAVTWAARRGVCQFLDLGCGLPASPNTHETAQAIIPGAQVVYVDNDEVALAHSRALLANGGACGAAAASADLADPVAVRALAEVRDLLDLSRPLCVLLGAVLHFWPIEQARAIVCGHMAACVPGSVLIASTGRNDDPEAYARVAALCSPATELYNFTRAQTESLFDGLELVPPGVVRAAAWRPGWRKLPRLRPERAYVNAGVAVKP